MAAKKKKVEKTKVKTKKAKIGVGTSLKLAVFLVLVCAAIFAASTMVFFVCMLPTFVAAVIDKQPQRTLWLTVGAMNLAGTVPAWFRLWELGGNITDSMTVLTNPGILMVAYAAAGMGWLIHMNITPLVAAMVVKRNEGRLRDIEKQQKELIRKWGEGIGRTIEP